MSLKNILETLEKNHNLRKLTSLKHEGNFVFKEGKKLLNLAGNDYLNLSFCKSLKDE
ncbi:pyridoxal phosphate-dependent aminotransferase family protein, partial [Campylobacter coli]|nr:pyridoxal phosphate-dependent aminotransferase family protein [Campylobacter coli]EKA7259197.1 pyridoxal phosphate-dependent aminotransferase family protein [Campylobacter coli]